MSIKNLAAVAEAFFPGELVGEIHELRIGNVHDTYVVCLGGGAGKKILQRINTCVFQQPARLMENMRLVTDHLTTAIQNMEKITECGWQNVLLCKTIENLDYFVDAKGGFWRCQTYINGASVYDKVISPSHGFETGRALGVFHRLLSDLDPRRLYDILPGFHCTSGYLAHYDSFSSIHFEEYATEVNDCRIFINRRRSWVSVLEEALHNGRLQPRVIHGDPKLSNILIDNATGRTAAIIDLDTVGSGLIHYDIGDCLRSCCNISGEETMALPLVEFDLDICRSILAGYLQEAGSLLTDSDIAYLYDAILLLPFELGIRFFTDYLAGNMYFKTEYETQNLYRALVQFRLIESIEEQEDDIRQLLKELCGTECRISPVP